MARPNKMWFRKDRNTYYVRIDGKLHNLGKDKKEAQTKFHELMAGKPEPLVERSITAAELMDAFLRWIAENRSPLTLDKHTRHLQAFLDSMSNQSISAMDVRPHYIDKLITGKGWSNNYKKTIIGSISGAFNWGVKRGHIDRSPIAGIDTPPAERREEYPSQKEFDVIAAKATEPFLSVLQFAYETGARPFEIRRMQPRHYVDGKIQFPAKESKGKKHARVIYLTDKAKAIVERGLRGEYLLTNQAGRQWTKDAINCRMRRIGEKTGTHYCLYSIRHLTATRWLEGGMDHLTVAKLLGHRDATMISRVYGHIGEKTDYLQQQVDKMG